MEVNRIGDIADLEGQLIYMIDQDEEKLKEKNEKKNEEKEKTKADTNKDEEDSEEEEEDEDQEEEIFDVVNSYIDFRPILLGMKLKQGKNFDEATKQEFDSYSLAELICQLDNNESVYTCISVKRLIDFQFVQTKPFFERNFLIYMFGYYLPFMMTVIGASY